MRRNGNRRGPMVNPVGGGPLMTDHLKDIDLELELLKRKRDMIEQQQHLLAMEQQFQAARNYDFEPESSNRDYSHLYDKSHSQFSRKRQAEPQWQYENTVKRTQPKKKGPQPPFNPRVGQVQPRPVNAGPANFRDPRPMPDPNIGLKNFPRGAVPLMSLKVKQSVGQKIANQNQKQNPPRKPITQNKVTKAKATPANKLAAQPVPERKKLVAAATVASSQADVTRMLLPDQVPTQQVTGRLELALGAIMKNIREISMKDSPHAFVLRSVEIQRVMKQAVRERIKKVMLGKVVGSMLEILALYREEFPPETDDDIVKMALEAIGVPASNQEEKQKFIKSDNPEDFFKKNMSYLLECRLTEMFDKLEEIYKEENPDAELTEGNPTAPEGHEAAEDTEEYQRFLETNIKLREVRRYLPRLLKKHLPFIIKLLNLDSRYRATKAEIATITRAKLAQAATETEPVVIQAPQTSTAPASSPMQSFYNLPYYVKIMGRPSLPKKKVMQQFMSQFNPKSIKKHRTIHNLLFIGFTEKTDFEAMLAADGTSIGRLTLSIRICGNRVIDNSNNPENNVNKDIDFSLDESQSGSKLNDSEDNDLISAELDGQITDLLSSIRKETDGADDGPVEEIAAAQQDIPEEIDLTNNDIVMKELDDEKDAQITETTENIPENDSNANEKSEIENELVLLEEEGEETSNTTETGPEESNLTETETKSEESDNIPPKTNPEVTNTTEEKSETTEAIENIESNGKETETTTAPVEEENIPSESKEETATEDKNANGTPTGTDAENLTEEKALELLENDRVGELKSASGRSTPTRSSARKAAAAVAACSIRTRRNSRLT